MNRKPWGERFTELLKFKKLYGHCDVSASRKDNPYFSLGDWASNQRRFYKLKKKVLSPEKIIKLENIGFRWSAKDNWGKYPRKSVANAELLAELKRISSVLKKSPTHTDVIRYGKYSLGPYVRRFGSLKNALKEIGVDDFNNTKWNNRFNELKIFKTKYGHCKVPISKKDYRLRNLGIWVNTQRQKYQSKNSALTPERIAKLNSIRFAWFPNSIENKRVRRKVIKKDMLNELKRIHSFLGRPPITKEINKHGKYTTSMYTNRFGGLHIALSKAGLSNFNNEKWNNQYNELKKFREKYGRFPHFSDKKYKKLEVWCRTQRLSYKLTAQRKKLLNQIRFPWSRFDEKWDAHFNKLKEFKNKFGHCSLKAVKINNRPTYINVWINIQRKYYHSKMLHPERIAKLDSIGFEWGQK